MATQALPRRRTTTRRRKKSRPRWLAWWPLLLAIAVTPFALKTAEILPLLGPAGLVRLRLLYPFALLAQHYSVAESISQSIMYLQFCVEALLLILLTRLRSFTLGLCLVCVLHLIGVAAVWLLNAHG